MVNIASMLHDYDKNLILAVIVIESEGKNEATSHRGAQGLMQLMPETAKSMGVKDSRDPFQNILAGTKYLKQLEDNYGFDSPQEALVAYNMGPSRARRWLSQYSAEDYGYVAKVMYVYGILAEQDKQREQLAQSIVKKMAAEESVSSGTMPFMTRPRTLSMSAFPMTLPNNRKEVTE
jgi:soluble lytic murein transglycosylase-like protein